MQTLIPEVLKATLRSYGDLPAAVRGPYNRRVMQALCVFCGSNAGRRPAYSEAARAMGQLLGARGITLVYGGGKVGLMGVVADACLAGGGKVIGVIPRLLQEKELAHQGLTEMHVVATMHERKAMMADLADGFLALPGGFGTWDEFCEVFTWSQLGIQSKACALLNVEGYYDPFLALADRATEEGFLRPEHRELLLVDKDGDRLLDRMSRFQFPAVPKWVGREER